MNKKSFLKGAAVLGMAGLITQVLGAFFRIPLGNIIGTDGMAYYSAAYTIYVFLLVFSTNGAPAAISKMTSERMVCGRYKEAHRVFKLSFIFMAFLGIIAFSVTFFGADIICNVIGNEGAALAMKAIAPALLFVPIMSVYRGYFQGMQVMEPTAVSQIAEQTIRVIAGLALAAVLLPYGLETAAAGAAAGGSIGPIVGIAVLIIVYYRRKREIFGNVNNDCSESRETAGGIIKSLALIAIPITIGVSIQPIMNLCDTVFVMNRLQDAAGFTLDEAEELFGALTGFAVPVINVPMSLALSMALALVPTIAAAKSSGDRESLVNNVRLGFRTAMIIGVPCSLGLMSLAEPVMKLLFPMQLEELDVSSTCLFILSAGIVLLCIAQTMAGILQGMGKVSYAVCGILAGAAVKCVSTYFLAGISQYNVNGAAFGTLLGYVTIALFNFMAVKRCTGISFDMSTSVIKPLAAGAIMTVIVLIAYRLMLPVLGNSIATLMSVCVGACVYGITLIKIKGITADELVMMPKGNGIVKILKKLRLL